MKKFIYAMLLLLCPFIVFSNTTENVVINGTINQYLNLAAQSNTVQLILTGDGSEAVGTDTITAVSNIKLWKITVTSSNSSYLVQDTLQVPYKVKIDNEDAATNSFSSFASVPTGGGSLTFTKKTKKGGSILAVTVKVENQNTTDELYEAGTNYKDTLVFTISVN